MPFKFPYTNFQELNLDWIIKKVKDLSKQIEDDSSIVSEYIDRLIAVEDKADNAEATATAADARATGANNTANSALTLATQAKQTAEIADLSTTLLGLKIGDLSSLFTTAKDTIVNAINEVWSIFHNATAVTNVTPAGTDPAVTYSNGVFTFDLPEGGDPDAVTHAELDAAIDDVEDRIDGLEDSIDDLSEALDDKADVIIDTASGDIARFPDGTATPLKALIVNVEPVQAGTGDPSPSNVRPISGWTGCEVMRTGKNLFPSSEYWETGTISPSTGEDLPDPNYWRTGLLSIVGSQTYAISYKGTIQEPAEFRWFQYDSNGNFLYAGSALTITLAAKVAYIRFRWGKALAIEDLQFEIGSTASDYEEYQGNSYTATFGKTVYGGDYDFIDGKGNDRLVKLNMADIRTWNVQTDIGRIYVLRPDLEPWHDTSTPIPNLLCNRFKTISFSDLYISQNEGVALSPSGALQFHIDGLTDVPGTTLADVNAYFAANETYVVAKLVTPTDISTTPTPITALKGYNAVWSDAGAVYVTYRADTKGYIDKLIAQVQALALGG